MDSFLGGGIFFSRRTCDREFQAGRETNNEKFFGFNNFFSARRIWGNVCTPSIAAIEIYFGISTRRSFLLTGELSPTRRSISVLYCCSGVGDIFFYSGGYSPKQNSLRARCSTASPLRKL